MKVLVTGAHGQLGQDLVTLLNEKEFNVYGYSREQLDITDFNRAKEVITQVNPEIIIHSAAHTKVDLAESEPDNAFLINAIGTRNIAAISEQLGTKLLYISTDYVFDGTNTNPINEFQDTKPLGVYGRSKLAGENYVRDLHSKFFILRTSWVFGKNGDNFVKTMLKLAQTNKNLKVVNDQIGSPTYTFDLSSKIIEIMNTEKFGTYHISNSGKCSWYEFAKYIFEVRGIKVDLLPCPTHEFPRPAPRPSYSVFDHMSLRLNGFKEMRDWKVAVKECIHQMEEV
jgi:dTDP-4-dehydrorhamnose reductase